MTTLLKFAALATIALTGPGTASAVDITGKWRSEFESPIGHLVYIYDLKADGEKLSGKAMRDQEGEKSETEIQEGKVAGGQVGFVELLRRDDQDIRIEYSGKVEGDEIKLTRKVGDFATMEIVAKRERASAGSAAAPAGTKPITLNVIKVDSEETAGEEGYGTNAVDGNPSTIWHTQWQDASPVHPHEIIIELNPPSRIKGITYLPRSDEEGHGNIKDYEIYLSDDGKDFASPVLKGEFGLGNEKKSASFSARSCRFIKLRALSEINGNDWTSAAEIGVVPE
jgi:hypothetical protein